MFDFFKKDKPPVKDKAPADASLPDSIPAELSQSWAERLKQGLAKTRNQLGNQLSGIFGGGKIDAEVYEELETILLTSDVGISATEHLLDDIKNRVKRQSLDNTAQLKIALKQAMLDLLSPLQKPLDTGTHQPFIIMLAGVNGAGKTTTIGKLAKHFQSWNARCAGSIGSAYADDGHDQRRRLPVQPVPVWL